MDKNEARLILQSLRPGEAEREDPQFALALAEAARDPELASWLEEEQAFDRAVAAQLADVAVPFGLKTRLLALAATPAPETRSFGKMAWAFACASLVALVLLVDAVVSQHHASETTAALMPNYTREMVSFVQLTPPLEMQTSDLGAMKNWLSQKSATTPQVPPRLAALQPLGCRVLSFRGRNVTLVCFRRDEAHLAHLFVVDRAALPKMKANQPPVFAQEGEWVTASWVEDEQVYTVAVQGDRATVERFLPNA